MANTFKIQQASKDLFLTKAPHYFNKEFLESSRFFGYTINHKALVLYVNKSINTNGDKILQAEIAWGYSLDTTVRAPKSFASNMQGFTEACRWLDEQRVVFAKELL